MIVYLKLIDVDSPKYRIIASSDKLSEILTNAGIYKSFMEATSIPFDESVKWFNDNKHLEINRFLNTNGLYFLLDVNINDVDEISDEIIPNLVKKYKRDNHLSDILSLS